MQDPDREYLITEREARDRDRYSGGLERMTTGLNFADLTLKEEVGEALAFLEDVDASQVDVDVRDGIVTLTGEVATEREKQEAFDCASDVDGVSTVINQIRIHTTSSR